MSYKDILYNTGKTANVLLIPIKEIYLGKW